MIFPIKNYFVIYEFVTINSSLNKNESLCADCLNEIFEHLEDEVDLHSCLLFNRRILCINIRREIIVSIPTSKPPFFNYVVFIKTF